MKFSGYGNDEPRTETYALINGKKTWFDAQCDNAKEPLYQKVFRYIGKSKTVYYNGREYKLENTFTCTFVNIKLEVR